MEDIHQKSYDKVRSFLVNLSKSRAAKGFSPTETATFVFSLKEAVLPKLQEAFKNDMDTFIAELTLFNDTMNSEDSERNCSSIIKSKREEPAAS